MSLELLLLASNINFVVFSIFLDDFLGQIYCFLIFTVGAAESSIGLAIVISFYRVRGSISSELIKYLKG
jgi:NADH-quinone oxidoreductase subunit K